MGFICHDGLRTSSAPPHVEAAEALPRLYKILLFNTVCREQGRMSLVSLWVGPLGIGGPPLSNLRIVYSGSLRRSRTCAACEGIV